MKFLVVSFALAAVAAAQYQTGYKEPVQGARVAAIVRQASEQNPDGTYNFNYETENGISVAESGAPRAIGPNGEAAEEVQGGYRYTAPDGQVIEVKYTAGPQGFVAEGNHLPVAPPIPEAILRALAYNAAHPQKEETEYYKPQVPTQKPIYNVDYTTPKPIYRPSTYQPTFQPGQYPQQQFGYNQQAFFKQPGTF